LATKGTGHGFGVQVIPANQMDGLVQRDWITRLHVLPAQQAPGWSQGFGEQAPPKAHVCEVRPQAVWSVNAHAPVMMLQQRPELVQGLGTHAPARVQAFGEGQFTACTNVQAWAASQHVPKGGHGLGEHTPP
jgi:hypothetical protein